MTVLRAASVALIMALSACGTTDPVATPTLPASSPPATASSPSPTAKAERLRVTDLMAKAGCETPKVIGTQLYSYETGRCTIGKDEITIAVFDTEQLREEWLKMARQFGGNFAVGAGWVVSADSPNVAKDVAGKLGGTVV